MFSVIRTRKSHVSPSRIGVSLIYLIRQPPLKRMEPPESEYCSTTSWQPKSEQDPYYLPVDK